MTASRVGTNQGSIRSSICATFFAEGMGGDATAEVKPGGSRWSISFYQKDRRVNVSVVGDDINVQLARAVPLGLLLNELVSNACKHAFPGDTDGQLEVRLNTPTVGFRYR